MGKPPIQHSVTSSDQPSSWNSDIDQGWKDRSILVVVNFAFAFDDEPLGSVRQAGGWLLLLVAREYSRRWHRPLLRLDDRRAVAAVAEMDPSMLLLAPPMNLWIS